MSINTSDNLSGRLRRTTMAIIASGIVIAPAVHANPSKTIVLVPPKELPELARQPGDAMMLRDTSDGRAVLYVEQNHGAQLAVFDVTDPRHVKSEGSVQLGTPGPFDFVSPLGAEEELVRYRQNRGEAVLDLHKAWLPTLEPLPGAHSQGPISLLGDDGLTVSGQAGPKASNPQPMQEYRVIDTSTSRSQASVFEVKQVREELTKHDTATTFLLTEEGLYLIRRPIAESDKRHREEDWFWQHTGG